MNDGQLTVHGDEDEITTEKEELKSPFTTN